MQFLFKDNLDHKVSLLHKDNLTKKKDKNEGL